MQTVFIVYKSILYFVKIACLSKSKRFSTSLYRCTTAGLYKMRHIMIESLLHRHRINSCIKSVSFFFPRMLSKLLKKRRSSPRNIQCYFHLKITAGQWHFTLFSASHVHSNEQWRSQSDSFCVRRIYRLELT